MKYLIAFLCVMILIVVHELGHYLMARAVGAKLDEYAVGFGPKLLSHVSKKTGIRYSINAIPLGGYCAFSDDEDDPHTLRNLSKWKQILTFAAGPAMNYLVASIMIMVVFIGIGVPSPINIVDSVKAGYHGTKQVEEGDLITAVNDTQVVSTDDLDNALASVGKDKVKLSIYRASKDQSFDVTVTPQEIQKGSGVYDLMIIRKTQNIRVPIMYGVIQGFAFPAEITRSILSALKDVIAQHNVNSLSSPVSLVQTVGEYATVSQIPYFMLYVAIISISVGLMNLLPIPSLDGSKIVFRIGEAIARKDMSEKVENRICIAFMIGFVVLAGYLIIRDVNVLISQIL